MGEGAKNTFGGSCPPEPRGTAWLRAYTFLQCNELEAHELIVSVHMRLAHQALTTVT